MFSKGLDFRRLSGASAFSTFEDDNHDATIWLYVYYLVILSPELRGVKWKIKI